MWICINMDLSICGFFLKYVLSNDVLLSEDKFWHHVGCHCLHLREGLKNKLLLSIFCG